MHRHRIDAGIIGLSLVLAMVAWAPGQVEASIVYKFGSVGLTQAQNARVNVVNIGAPSSDIPPGPCTLRVVFLNAAGGTIRTYEDPNEMPGETKSFDLGPLDFSPPPARAQIRAEVTVAPGPCRNMIIPTLEVIDVTSGETMIILSLPRF